ncbi:MAG: T9SS type A sorting domain-containing protein [Bacteroidota bacterium]
MKTRRLLLVMILGLVGLSGKGQNLVPNSSFEIYDTCPYSNTDQIHFAVGWISSLTPDYFNTCATSTLVSVPNNAYGFHYAASGNAYAGFYAKHYFLHNYREHAVIHLISSLLIGTRYYVSIKVSLTPLGDGTQYCGVNKLGVLFSTIQYDDFNPTPINNFAHVYTDSIISDTLNWVTIKGSFLADSNYSFVNIGNCFNDMSTDTIQIAGSHCTAYYYLDDVCVSTDSTYAYNYIYTGTTEINHPTSSILSPNPFTTQATLTIQGLKNENNKTLSVYNLLGQEVQNIFVGKDKEVIIHRNNLPSGMYFYKLTDDSKTVLGMGKMVVE